MSDLLNKASLVVIPSGYKEDTVYSVVPSDGSGDLSFTRASNGTRINSAGLVEVVPWNMSGYSEEFNNAYWTKAGATITANDTTAPNGTTTADKVLANAANSEHGIYNATAYASNFVGEVYTYSVYAKKGTVDFLVLDHYQGSYTFTWFNLNTGTLGTVANGVTASIENVGNGWYRCSCTKAITATTLNYMGIYLSNANNTWSFNSAGTETIYIWGAQVNLATAKPYFPTTDRLNVPRLTYQNGGGGCPSLLLEKQSTNVLTYSEQFDQWNTQDASVTANQITSPDGTQNADKIVENNQNQAHYIYSNTGTYASADYTVSVYAKAGERSILQLLFNGSTNINAFANFDLTNGVAYPTSSTATITAVGNGWYRCTITATLAAATLPLVYFAIETSTSATRAQAYAGNGTSGLYLWGAQSEQSSYVTSLIQTTSASATKVADTYQKAGIGNTSTAGTLFYEFEAIKIDSPNGQYLISLFAGSSVGSAFFADGNAITICGNGGQIQIFNNGYSQLLFTTVPAVGANVKIAIRYDGTNVVAFVNGVKQTVYSDTAVGVKNAIRVNNAENGSQATKQLIFFPTALTDAECISLTTL